MISSQKSMFLAGLVLSALAITVSVLRSGKAELSASQSSFEHYGASTSGAVDEAPAPSVRSGPVSADNSADTDVAQVLQAVRDNLQRNDPVSAKQLLDAVHALHKDNKQVLALQRSLETRESKAKHAAPVAQTDWPERKLESNRSASRSIVTASHSRESAAPVREHATSVERSAPATGASQVKMGLTDAAHVDAAIPASGGGERVAIALPAASTVADAPAASPVVERAQPEVETAQVAQPDPVAADTDRGPKTRAQVRAELDRARTNGGLPRFGNPDPKGPGGAPSTTVLTTMPSR
ncbi:hypothetical protein [Paraburkholderia sp. GAS334]|uniref:hypothetical protein n=1 Tax=Paraburkholderia sp. GAS334 TaxID=3035131 RepID=UPI003D248D47